MAHGVDASVNPVQPPMPNAFADGALAEPERLELTAPNEAELPLCDRGQSRIQSG
jgi:hypothetical protein